jgi:hypothetical protein
MEVSINNVNANKFPLPLDETLRDAKRITGIVAYNVSTVSVGPVSKLANVNNTVFAKAFLTVTDRTNLQTLQQLPLADLARTTNAGIELNIDVNNFDPTKSYIEVATTASLSTNEVFILRFEYEP